MPTGISCTSYREIVGTEAKQEQIVARKEQTGGVALRTLLEGVNVRSAALTGELRVRQISNDSRKVQPGALFVAIHGLASDGNLFARDAATRGALAILSENAAPADWPKEIPWIQVNEGRKTLATLAANFYGHPAKALKLVGVTGTNGKTTTTSLIDSILRASGAKTGLFGTIAYHTPLGEHAAPNTTPESLDLQSFFAEIRDAGGTHATMEASSHALSMDRLWGCHFAAAVFTNLTRDHIDYHKTFENYFAAKRLLFEGTGAGVPDVSVINTDDAWGKKLTELGNKTLTYGLLNDSDLKAKRFQLSFKGLSFTAQTPNGPIQVESSLVGRINVYNILAAIGTGIGLGFSNEVIEAGVRKLRAVAGRFERVDRGQPFLVVVDYAHTNDALENLIRTARELNAYVYFRRNVAGVQREWWYHRSGCRTWFQAERDTRTNRVLRVGLPGELGGSGGEVGGSDGQPSGSGPGEASELLHRRRHPRLTGQAIAGIDVLPALEECHERGPVHRPDLRS